MFCPLTGKPCSHPKNVHVTESVDGKPNQMFICEGCAADIEQITGGTAVEPPAAPPPYYTNAGLPPVFKKPATPSPTFKGPPGTPPSFVKGPPGIPEMLFGLPMVPLKASSPLAYFQQMMEGMEAKHREDEILAVPCPDCGHTLADFKAKGRLGCPACYVFFKNQIGPLLQHCHEGSLQHAGKVPPAQDVVSEIADAVAAKAGEREMIQNSLDALQKKMDAAVKEERYEDAGRVRDQIKYLKAKLEG